MKNRLLSLPLFFAAFLHGGDLQKKISIHKGTGTLKISFINTVKGKLIQLNEATYTNAFSEQYTVSKFKYYISNVMIASANGNLAEKESYHLVDESKPGSLSFSFPVPSNTYHSLLFMLGVDSLRNVSGAQTGALDPLNDMFWTWNSGYVMAKMEGNSPQSGVVNNKIEYHVGGFSGTDNVLKTFNFPLSLKIKEGRTTEIIVEADLDTWWKDPNELKISANAVCTTPGPLAKKISDNYRKMFSIKNIRD